MNTRHLIYWTLAIASVQALTACESPALPLTALTALIAGALAAWGWSHRCQPWLPCGGVAWEEQASNRPTRKG